jgi:hypothetical protein
MVEVEKKDKVVLSAIKGIVVFGERDLVDILGGVK